MVPLPLFGMPTKGINYKKSTHICHWWLTKRRFDGDVIIQTLYWHDSSLEIKKAYLPYAI